MKAALKHWPENLSEAEERDLTKFHDEIHARITWGDREEDLRGWILQQRVEASPELIEEMIASAKISRDRSLRKLGLRDWAIGFPLALPGIGSAIVGAWFIYEGSGGRLALAGIIVGVIAAAVGLWLVVRGFDRVVFGAANRGGVDDNIFRG